MSWSISINAMSSKNKKFCKYPFCETTINRMIRRPSRYIKKNFYQFPKDSRLAKWKKVCNIHPNVKSTHFYICEDHFLPSDFMPNSPNKLNSKAIPKERSRERSMPDEINEHNYAVSPKNFISTEQKHKKTYEKNTPLYINWATASTDDKINFLNSFFENQENLMYAKTNPQKFISQDEASSNFISSEQSELNVKTMESSNDIKDYCIDDYNSLNIDFIGNKQTLIDSKSSHGKTWNTCSYVQPNSSTDLTIIDGSLISLLPVQVGLPPSECNMDISDYSPFKKNTIEKNNSELPFQIKSVFSLSDSKSKETAIKNQEIWECKFPSCSNSYSQEYPHFIMSRKIFFHFPTKISILKAWKEVCGIDSSVDCSDFYICEDHFSLADFKDSRHPIKLHINAIPRSLSKIEQDEHNYAHQKPCLLNDHNCALNLND